MTLIPAFEVGVWNAWILMLCSLIPLLLALPASKGREKGSNFTADFSNTQKNVHHCFHVVYFLLLVYSIFLPLQLGSVWCYAGLTIYLLALIPYTIGFVNVATTPRDKSVIRGVYRYSRHPIYLTSFLMFIGVGIASASWIFLLLSVIFIILSSVFVASEESFCAKHYGDTYRAYMNRTPRWIGIPKSDNKR